MIVIADFPMQISDEMSRAPGGRGGVKRCLFDLWEFSKKRTVQKDPSFLRKGDVSKNHQPVKNCTVSSNFSDSSEIFRVLRGGGGGAGGGDQLASIGPAHSLTINFNYYFYFIIIIIIF